MLLEIAYRCPLLPRQLCHSATSYVHSDSPQVGCATGPLWSARPYLLLSPHGSPSRQLTPTTRPLVLGQTSQVSRDIADLPSPANSSWIAVTALPFLSAPSQSCPCRHVLARCPLPYLPHPLAFSMRFSSTSPQCSWRTVGRNAHTETGILDDIAHALGRSFAAAIVILRTRFIGSSANLGISSTSPSPRGRTHTHSRMSPHPLAWLSSSFRRT